MSGDIFDYHDWGGCISIYRVETKDAAKHPTIHRTDLTTKNYLTQNVNSAMVEKPCSRSRKAEF